MRSWDYSHDMVCIACRKCGRAGRYSKARFLELVGRNTTLPEALAIIAADCPDRPKFPGGIHSRCGVYYPDLNVVPDKTDVDGQKQHM